MATLITVVPERDYPGHIPTGPVGRALAGRLLAAGEPVRVLAPPSEAAGWPPSAEVVAGDIACPAETPAAFDGLERMFLAGAVPETVRQAVTLARRGGVRRIAVLSSHGPDIEIEFGPDSWYWLAIEVVVERSGAQWTHLQPAPIMAQTLRKGYPQARTDLAAAIRDREVIRAPQLDRECPFLDEDDLAAIAAAVLFEDGYTGQTLTVHGAPISLRDQLRLIGNALGRHIPFEELPEEQPATDADRDDPDYRRWLDLGLTTATRVLGRPPRAYPDWLADHLPAALQ